MKISTLIDKMQRSLEELAADYIAKFLDEHISLELERDVKLSFYPDYTFVKIHNSGGGKYHVLAEKDTGERREFELYDFSLIPITDLVFIVQAIETDLEF